MSSPVPPAESESFSAAQRWCWALGLLVLYGCLAFYQLHQLPLVDPDEPRYAAAGRTMSEGGSLLIPEFNGVPRINKPPMFYWLVGISDWVAGGSNEFTSRLPAVLMGMVMLFGTVFFGRKVFGDRVAFWAGLVLATSPTFMVVSRTCIPDQCFSTFLALALLCLMTGISGHWTSTKISSSMAAGLFLGLGFMAKATAGFIVLITPLIFALAFQGRAALRKYDDREPRWGPAILIALAMGLWWYGYLISHFGWQHFKNLVAFEVGARFSGAMHKQPPYYYIPILLGTFFPWSLGLAGIFGSAYSKLDPHDESPAARRAVADNFLLAWAVTVFIFFSVPGAKLAHYLLPMFPALALLTARCFERLSGVGQPISRGLRVAMLAFPLLLGVVLFAGGWSIVNQEWPDKLALTTFAVPFGLVAVVLIIASAWWFLHDSVSGFLLGLCLWSLVALGVTFVFPVAEIYLFRKSWLQALHSGPGSLGEIGPRVMFLMAVPWMLVVVRPKAVKFAVVTQAVGFAVIGLIAMSQLLSRIEDRSEREFALTLLSKPEFKGVDQFYQAECDNKESLKYYLKQTVSKIKKLSDPVVPGVIPPTYPEIYAELMQSAPPGKLVLIINRRNYEWFLLQKPPAGSREWARSEDGSLLAFINQP